MQDFLYPQYNPASTQTPPTTSPQSTWKDWNFPPAAIATSQKKVIFHAVVECRISANKMQVHRIPDVGRLLFVHLLFICCTHPDTLHMGVSENGVYTPNGHWIWRHIVKQHMKWYPICGQTHTPTKYDWQYLSYFIITHDLVYHTILYSGKYDILYIVYNSDKQAIIFPYYYKGTHLALLIIGCPSPTKPNQRHQNAKQYDSSLIQTLDYSMLN